MKKYLKQSVYLAVLLGSFSACTVHAEINDKPIAGQQYGDFVANSDVLEANGEYHFNKGVAIEIPENVTGKQAIFVDDGKSAVINIGSAENKQYDGSFISKGGAVNVGKDANLVINTNDADLLFKSDYNSNQLNVIHLKDGSAMKVEATSMRIDGSSKFVMDQKNMFLEGNSKAEINLNGDFVSNTGGDGIVLKNSEKGSASISINANNIVLNNSHNDTVKRGIYITSYGDAVGKSNITLNAKDKIVFSGSDYLGINTYQSSADIELQAKSIEIDGIVRVGWDSEHDSSSIKIGTWNDKKKVTQSIKLNGGFNTNGNVAVGSLEAQKIEVNKNGLGMGGKQFNARAEEMIIQSDNHIGATIGDTTNAVVNVDYLSITGKVCGFESSGAFASADGPKSLFNVKNNIVVKGESGVKLNRYSDMTMNASNVDIQASSIYGNGITVEGKSKATINSNAMSVYGKVYGIYTGGDNSSFDAICRDNIHIESDKIGVGLGTDVGSILPVANLSATNIDIIGSNDCAVSIGSKSGGGNYVYYGHGGKLVANASGRLNIESNKQGFRMYDGAKVDLTAKDSIITGASGNSIEMEFNTKLDLKADTSTINGDIVLARESEANFNANQNIINGQVNVDCSTLNIKSKVGDSTGITQINSVDKSAVTAYGHSLDYGIVNLGQDAIIRCKVQDKEAAKKDLCAALVVGRESEINMYKENRYEVYGNVMAGHKSSGTGKGGVINLAGNNSLISGDILAVNSGTINVDLTDNSRIEGRIDDFLDMRSYAPTRPSDFGDEKIVVAGRIKMNLEKSQWDVSEQSWVSEVTLNNSVIDLSKADASAVIIGKLNGKGTFNMNLNSDDVSKGDMLYIGDGSGEFAVNIVGGITGGYDNISEDNPLRFATVGNFKGTFDVAKTYGSASTTGAGLFDIEYKVDKVEFDKNDPKNEQYNSADKPSNEYVEKNVYTENNFYGYKSYNWVITGVDKKIISQAGDTIIDMSRANYKNAVYMDRLNKRLGEARYLDGNDGIWVRMRHDRIGMKDEFRSSNTMYQAGYDKLYKSGDAGERHAGVAIDYLDGSTSYTKVGGEGDSKRYGLWMYDTWFGDKGHYTDYVVKYGHMKNDFDITAMTTGEQITGDYNNNMFSASAEYGCKHEFGDDWYVEPQVQLQFARITGADYATTQGTDVSVDVVNSLIARAGFRLGKDIDERSNVYIKADVMHEFLGDQDIAARDNTGTMDRTFENKGTWYDLGFGFTTALSDNSYAYLDVEQSFGNDNDDTYEINVGMQWSF